MKTRLPAMTAVTTISLAVLGSANFALAGQKIAKPQIQIPAVRIIKPNLALRAGLQSKRRSNDADGGSQPQSPMKHGVSAAFPKVAVTVPPLPRTRPVFEHMNDIAGADELAGFDASISGEDIAVIGREDLLDNGLGASGGPDADGQNALDGLTGGGLASNGDPRGKDMLGGGRGFANPVGEDSHAEVAPGSGWAGVGAVNGDTINSAIAGIASDQEVEVTDRTYDQDGDVTVTKQTMSDGSVLVMKAETVRRDSDGEPIGSITTGTTTDGNGVVRSSFTDVSNYRNGENRREERHHPPIAHEWMPRDDVPGGGFLAPNCGAAECNAMRKYLADPKGAAGDLADGGIRKAPSRDGAVHGTAGGGQQLVSEFDLVSQPNPDNAAYRGSGKGPLPQLENRGVRYGPQNGR